MASKARVSKEIEKLLKSYSSLQIIEEGKKVKCDLSGHEMPCKADAINSYIKGKKFKKLKHHDDFDYDQYKPHIVSNMKKHHEHQLFCKLTLRTLNKQPDHVLRHVNGKRYKKALKRWEECRKAGVPFVPRGKQQKQKSKDASDDGGDDAVGHSDDDESDRDSILNDLYPSVDSSNSEEEMDAEEAAASSESDFDFEEETPTSQQEVKKRKNTVEAAASSESDFDFEEETPTSQQEVKKRKNTEKDTASKKLKTEKKRPKKKKEKK